MIVMEPPETFRGWVDGGGSFSGMDDFMAVHSGCALLTFDPSLPVRFRSFLVLMIVYNFNFVSVFAHPSETNSPLLVDADAMLPLPIPLERFQPVSGRNPQVLGKSPRHSTFVIGEAVR